MADLDEKLRNWLESQGYPLEMRVARSFRQRRFRVFQSEYYKNPESGVMRETDVRPSMQVEIQGFLLRLGFVIECKHSKDKPWVLFTAPTRLADAARVAQRAASRLGDRLLMRIAQEPRVQRLPLFDLPERSAYGMTQAFTTGNDVTYAAAQTVAKAATAEASEFDSRPETRSRLAEIVFPVIVVDGMLFEAFLQDDGEMALCPVASGTLLWRNPTGANAHTIIKVLAKDEVDRFAEDASVSIREFFELCSEPLAAFRAQAKTAEPHAAADGGRDAGS